MWRCPPEEGGIFAASDGVEGRHAALASGALAAPRTARSLSPPGRGEAGAEHRFEVGTHMGTLPDPESDDDASVASAQWAAELAVSTDRRLLLDAFDGMSLADRCAMWQGLSGAVAPGCASLVGARAGQADGGAGFASGLDGAARRARLGVRPAAAVGSGAASVSLFAAAGADLDPDDVSKRLSSSFAAMSLMNDSERFVVATQAATMTRNVRGWILRRNYRRMQRATKTLQNATKSFLSKRSDERGLPLRLGAIVDDGEEEAAAASGASGGGVDFGASGGIAELATAMQAAARGRMVRSRVKRQRFAAGRVQRAWKERAAAAAGASQRASASAAAARHRRRSSSSGGGGGGEGGEALSLDDEEHDAATLLQSKFKAVNAKRQFAEMKKQLAACLVIERQLLAWRDSRRRGYPVAVMGAALAASAAREDPMEM